MLENQKKFFICKIISKNNFPPSLHSVASNLQ